MHSHNIIMLPPPVAEYTTREELLKAAQEFLDHLVTEESPVGKSYWMRMLQLGDGIANAYQRPVHFYSSTGSSLTFLPSFSLPNDNLPICFAFVDGNHFIALKLQENAPAAPVVGYWRRFATTQAHTWSSQVQSHITEWIKLCQLHQKTPDIIEIP
ncbi:hypothetical protein FRX31_010045 [Thalictrum thalictroides]|uniref:Uncharacterized protein n=1 Tax=Thalictrum thalictroides TaxID=46969 RepID=A0A7J6WSL0_THATH|nr:hypothetical protein FRX31_010045 [Thalictrum thalictroides]